MITPGIASRHPALLTGRPYGTVLVGGRVCGWSADGWVWGAGGLFAFLHDFEAPVGCGAHEEAAFAFEDAEDAFAGGDFGPWHPAWELDAVGDRGGACEDLFTVDDDAAFVGAVFGEDDFFDAAWGAEHDLAGAFDFGFEVEEAFAGAESGDEAFAGEGLVDAGFGGPEGAAIDDPFFAFGEFHEVEAAEGGFEEESACA